MVYPPYRLKSPPRSRPRVWWWVLVPLLTLGLGTFVMVQGAAVYLRSRWYSLAALGYFLLSLLFLSTGHSGPPLGTLGLLAFVLTWFGGTAHVALLQTRIRRMESTSGP